MRSKFASFFLLCTPIAVSVGAATFIVPNPSDASVLAEIRVVRPPSEVSGVDGDVQFSLYVSDQTSSSPGTAIAILESPWFGPDDIGHTSTFSNAETAEFLAALLDGRDSNFLAIRHEGEPGSFVRTGALFSDFLHGNDARGSVLESEVFGIPNLENLQAISEVQYITFTATDWGGQGRSAAGTFAFVVPEPSTAFLLTLGLIGLTFRKRPAT
jgi:PEP-CTERM motif